MNVAIITARGGSKRIKKKNIKPFQGRPIIEYPIRTAFESGLFTRVIVSTECEEIAEISRRAGAEILHRPAGLADDKTTTAEVLEHALGEIGCGYACCIYPTAVFLRAHDLRDGFAWVRDDRFDHVYAALSVQGRHLDVGYFYWVRRAKFLKNPTLSGRGHAILIPDRRAIDINTMKDWTRAEGMAERMHAD